MRKKIENLIRYIVMTNSKQIYQELCRQQTSVYLMAQKKAAEETFRYIQDKMPLAQIFFSTKSLIEFAIQSVTIFGSFLEFGVYKGGSISFIAEKVKQEVHGFDSFEGLPEAGKGTYWARKMFDLKECMPKVPENVILNKGWFEDTIPEFLKRNKEDVTFLHLDPDLYSSHKTIFTLLGARIKKGTIIVFDDYFDFVQWQLHGFKAFEEFVHENNVKYEYLGWRGGREIGSENGGVCVRINEIHHGNAKSC